MTQESEKNPVIPPSERRSFFQTFSALLLGFFALIGGIWLLRLLKPKKESVDGITISDHNSLTSLKNENIQVRMHQELKRAMAKPLENRKWAMIIDLRKCTGCGACTVSCIAENQLPPGVVYRPVIEEEIGTYPNVSMKSIPRPCMQCANPPCVPVCPVNATKKRKDGITDMDYEQCIGCRYCMTACPYHARTFDFGYLYTENTPKIQPYEQTDNFEYNKRWKRKGHDSPVGNVRKCHFCQHKLEEGLLPSCVTTCIGEAMYFGDVNDPDSMAAKLITSRNKTRLKEEMGTDPQVYYLL